MTVLRSWWAAAGRHTGAWDVALAAFLVIVSLVEPGMGRAAGAALSPLSTLQIALLVAGSAALALRRTHPVAVLTLTVLAVGAVVALGGLSRSGVAAIGIAGFSVGAWTNRRTTWIAAPGAAAVLVGAALVGSREVPFAAESFATVFWVGLTFALGDATRSRRAYVSAVEERARRAEESREEEARRRVAEDRLSIARDLHDVIAHNIAVINVQANVANHLLRTDQDAAADALSHVRRSAQTVLSELGTVLSVLRQPADAAPTDPTPNLQRLPELVDSFRAIGLPVTVTETGPRTPYDPSVELVAYRVVQELLTNVHKHNPGAATTVLLGRDSDALRVDVVNAPGRPVAPLPGNGYGLVGMRERVTAIGGTVEAGPTPAGGFRVRAVLPTAES
ncbi:MULTISPECIES: sensor histidine kinase [unclassified Ornithinimicrobium]|uniref:sensor histidine kinase n=1 Tax=unclassified Ornithinimicrobium TaxID=2615080 RepID=UPI0038528AEF